MENLTTEDAQNHYEQMAGGKLKNIEEFGVDPLEGKRELQERRKQSFYYIFKSAKNIFLAVMQKKSSILENAITYFQNLTIDYSANDNIVKLCNVLYIFFV